ncbi:unnamed protein product, partial [Mesorhabditis belari]|uniref:Malonyl-CoA decarboxylase n=1 Tax=Mesorhabditis belari TaxID=2138241 RepID=A0AAF3EVV5_9BILA
MSVRLYSRRSITSLSSVLNVLKSRPTPDQLTYASRSFLDAYTSNDVDGKTKLLLELGQNAGVNHADLEGSISRYSKNNALFMDVRSAATPGFYTLFQSIGNVNGGVKHICDLREFLLDQIRIKSTEKSDLIVLRRLEETCRELLTSWFCLSNLKLCRLTWESPGDIIQKVANYEAVHRVHGLVDIRRRLGPHRRCFYFLHEALPREPLVIVHVALTDQIASNVQKITKDEDLNYPEANDNTAIYYSITSTQKGLSGVDLGNLLIKSVAAQISKEEQQISTHSTLSPIPGFRSWLLRALKEPQNFGNVISDFCLEHLTSITKQKVDPAQARTLLLNLLCNERIELEKIEIVKPILQRLCAQYLCVEKRNGYALNPVANFHLRNGAEVFRVNWRGDTSVRGLYNSFGIMVNYRYVLENVNTNSSNYVNKKVVAIDSQVKDLLFVPMDFAGQNVWSDYTCDQGNWDNFSSNDFSFTNESRAPKPAKVAQPKVAQPKASPAVGADGLTKAERRQKNREAAEAARAAKVERKMANIRRQEETKKLQTEKKNQRAQKESTNRPIQQLNKRETRKRKFQGELQSQIQRKRSRMSDIAAQFKKSREDYATNVSPTVKALIDDYCKGLQETPGCFALLDKEIVGEAPIIPFTNLEWATGVSKKKASILMDALDLTFTPGSLQCKVPIFPSLDDVIKNRKIGAPAKKLEDEIPTVEAQARSFATSDLDTLQGYRFGAALIRKTMGVPKEKREELWKQLLKTIADASNE